MHAIKIFELMVGAEATAHHIVPERVVFEAGAWNSLAQVVGAATLIDALDTAQWSASGFPSGGAVSLVTRRGSSKQAWMVGTVTIKGVAARRRGGAPGRRHRGGPGIFRGGLASIPPVAEETIWHGLRPVHGGRAPG